MKVRITIKTRLLIFAKKVKAALTTFGYSIDEITAIDKLRNAKQYFYLNRDKNDYIEIHSNMSSQQIHDVLKYVILKKIRMDNPFIRKPNPNLKKYETPKK